ncbi:MAG TPA: hypothetical protein VN763_00920, partial [Saprospiraceae bacterium]|nr:hypothetical protein [Saprospiraceae bacterium]
MKHWTRTSPLLLNLFMVILLMGYHNRGEAQVSLTGFGTTYTQDFNTLAITDLSSVVPVGWSFAEAGSNANSTYDADDGGSTTGNTYSYGIDAITERAFGGLQSGTLNPTIGAFFTNNTGGAIGSLMISYKGEQWRVGTLTREDRLDFQYSLTATGLLSGTYVNYDLLDFTSPIQAPVGPLNGNVFPNFTVVSSTIMGLSIGNGNTFWIRWSDFNAILADDGEAVDS